MCTGPSVLLELSLLDLHRQVHLGRHVPSTPLMPRERERGCAKHL